MFDNTFFKGLGVTRRNVSHDSIQLLRTFASHHYKTCLYRCIFDTHSFQKKLSKLKFYEKVFYNFDLIDDLATDLNYDFDLS